MALAMATWLYERDSQQRALVVRVVTQGRLFRLWSGAGPAAGKATSRHRPGSREREEEAARRRVVSVRAECGPPCRCPYRQHPLSVLRAPHA